MRFASIAAATLCAAVCFSASTSTAWGQGAAATDFAVAPSGAFTYAIPVRLPRGTGDIQPTLSLQYSSQANGGSLGIGWNLQGLPSISRCPGSIGSDRSRTPIQYKATDRYCLGDQKLILVAGTYGADGSEYKLESDDFTKIQAFSLTGIDSATGPGRFVATLKSGSVIEYGGATATIKAALTGVNAAATWAFKSLRNTTGTQYEASYTQKGSPVAVTVLDSIKYAPNYSVDFEYDSKTPTPMAYVGGAAVRTPPVINKIKVSQAGTPVWQYALTYASTGTATLPTLTAVELCASTGACEPKWDIAWSSSTKNYGTSINSTPGGLFQPTAADATRDVGYFVDANGDGRADYVSVWKNYTTGNRNIAVYLAQANGSYATLINSDVGCCFDPAASDAAQDSGEFLDVNGDGAADYVVVWKNTSTLNRVASVFLAKGDGTYAPAVVTDLGCCFAPITGDARKDTGSFADVNGDGLPDYTVVWKNATTSARNIVAFLSKGDGTFAPAVNTDVGCCFNADPNDASKDRGSFTDVNGDGLADYTVVWKNFSNNARIISVFLAQKDGTFAQGVHNDFGCCFSLTANENNKDEGTFIDVNGDGLPDYTLVWKNYNTGARNIAVYASKGDGTFVSTANTDLGCCFGAIPGNAYKDQGSFIDVNGDGLPDYTVAWKNASTNSRNIAVFLAKGDGTFTQGLNSDVGCCFSAVPGDANKDEGAFLDFNGDGLPDYVVVWRNYSTEARNIAVYTALGDGTFAATGNYDLGCCFGPAAQDANKDAGQFQDVNGDGIADYAIPWSNGGNRNLAVFPGRFEPYPTIVSMGRGGTTSLNVSLATPAQAGASLYSRTAKNPIDAPSITFTPTRLVTSEIQVLDGLGGIRRSSYSYGNMTFAFGERAGVRGYQWTQSKDESTGLVNRTYYRQDFPFIGMVDKVGRGTSAANWNNLGVTTNAYTFKAFAANDASYANPVTCVDDVTTGRPLTSCVSNAVKPGNRYVPYAHQVLDRAWDWNEPAGTFIALPQTRTSTTQDNWGNATQIKVEMLKADGTASGYAKTTDSVFAPADTANWRLGRALKSTVTSTTP